MLRPIAVQLMKLGITAKGSAMLRDLGRKSRDVKASQHAVLSDILTYAKDTIYGREHRFGAIRTPSQLGAEVPVNDYEALRPYVARHARGEPDVLFPGRPMFYATTSGTTSEPKLIPITRKYHDECYNGLTKLWFYSMLKEMPGFMDGRDLAMVGKAVEGETPDGTTFGSFSGHMNAYMPRFVRQVRVVPAEVHDADDYTAKYYTLMRVAMEHPIRMIVAANPSNLVELHRVGMAHFENIVYDIETGKLRSDLSLAPDIRRAVEARLRPNPRRAAELKALAASFGTLLPRHYWPTLEVVNTWKQGNSGLYLKHTEGFYPEETVIREFGYLATEARAGIILRNDQEASILAAHMLFFEFIKKNDYDEPDPRVYLAHEVEVGEEYYLVITTPSGLYRYDMNDIVRVEGFYNEFPMIRFIQKGKGVTSLTGEKLYETQYMDAVQQTERSSGVRFAFHIAFGDLDSSRYHVFVESETPIDGATSARIATVLDEHLAAANMEYRAKRRSNRLNPPVLHLLEPGAFVAYKQRCLEEGAREGQFKLTQLCVDHDRFKAFANLARDPAPGEHRSRGASPQSGS